MSNQLHLVTLTDLGTYQVTVAADTPAEAESIAKTVLTEEATTLPAGMSIVTREATATVEPALDANTWHYRVNATYRLAFSMTVPATDRAEAELHARRLYENNCGPFEFEHTGDDVGPFVAREVAS